MPLPSPRGAPGEAPPCNLHFPFGMAGDRQEFPARFRAPQRGAACAMQQVDLPNRHWVHGVAAHFSVSPATFAGSLRPSFSAQLHLASDHRPTSIADVDVLYHNGLLSAAADFRERQHAVLVALHHSRRCVQQPPSLDAERW